MTFLISFWKNKSIDPRILLKKRKKTNLKAGISGIEILVPKTENKEQRTYTNKLIESVRKDPYAYHSLRKDVDAGLMTRDQAFEVLKAWQKVVDDQEIAYKKNNKDELQQILSSEKKPDSETEQYTYPENYRVKDITEQFDILRETLNLPQEFEIPDHDLSNDSTIREIRNQLQMDHGNPEKIDSIFYIPPIYLVANAARKEHPEETKNKADDAVSTWYVLKRLKEKRVLFSSCVPPLQQSVA